MFPFLFSYKNEPLKEYEKFKTFLNTRNKEIEVEISCRLQHFAMCLDSSHFFMWGNRLYKKRKSGFKNVKTLFFLYLCKRQVGKGE